MLARALTCKVGSAHQFAISKVEVELQCNQP
jgi:hypothetical protein